MGAKPDKNKKGNITGPAAHDQARGRRIYSDACFSRRLEAVSARQGFKRTIQLEGRSVGNAQSLLGATIRLSRFPPCWRDSPMAGIRKRQIKDLSGERV